MDATMLMNLQEKVMAWPMPDSQIAQAIFAQYIITPMVSPTLPSLVETEGTTTQRGTDIRFLRRLAQRNGYECFVQPRPAERDRSRLFRSGDELSGRSRRRAQRAHGTRHECERIQDPL